MFENSILYMYAWVKEKRVKSKKYPRVKNRKNPKKRI